MKQWKPALKQWTLALASITSIFIGSFALQACGGEGGSVGGNNGGGGGDPSITQQFRALLTEAQATATYVGPQKCGTCHGGSVNGDDVYGHWQNTMHQTKDVTCENCHGPGSAHAASPAKTNILTFPKAIDPVVCGQCHGPIFQDWSQSPHAQLLTTPIESTITSTATYKNSQCMACHSALMHNLTTDRGINESTLPDADVLTIAQQTLTDEPHSTTCVTCHNPHMKTGNLTDNGKEVQLRKPVFNTDTAAIDPASPPQETTNYNQICAQCHNGRGANPSDAALATASRPNMHDSNQMNMLLGIGGVEGSGPVIRNTAHANIPGQCTTCHMPDSRHTYTVSFDKGCAPCHTPADAAARSSSVKEEVISGLYALKARMARWAQTNLGDERFWDYPSLLSEEGVTPPNQALVPMEVKRARHNFYFDLRDGSMGPHNAPYAMHLIQVANDNLDAIGATAPVIAKASVNQMLQSLQADRQRARSVHAQLED